jgi:hypothetical protein
MRTAAMAHCPLVRGFWRRGGPGARVARASMSRKSTRIAIFAAGKLIQAGQLPRGSMRVHKPGVSMGGIFRGPYDVLHLHVPNTMIAEYAGAECGRTRSCPLITDHPIADPVIERLGCALIHAEELGGALGQSYAEGIGLAITAHCAAEIPTALRQPGSGFRVFPNGA